MPRPQPIIIPGPMGMGGSWKKTETNLQLDKILNLIGGIQALRNDAANKQANELGAAQAMNALFPARQPMAQDMETGAPVEAAGPATPASIQYPDIAKSPIGQQTIFDLLGKSQKATGEDKWTVEEFDNKKYQVYGDGRKIELGNVITNKGAEAKNFVRDNIDRGGVPHTVVYDQQGKELADLGPTHIKADGTGAISGDKFFARMLDKVSSGVELTDSETQAMKMYMEAKRLSSYIPGMINPTEDIMEKLFPKKSKQTGVSGFPKVLEGVQGTEGKDRYTEDNGKVWDWDYKKKAWVSK